MKMRRDAKLRARQRRRSCANLRELQRHHVVVLVVQRLRRLEQGVPTSRAFFLHFAGRSLPSWVCQQVAPELLELSPGRPCPRHRRRHISDNGFTGLLGQFVNRAATLAQGIDQRPGVRHHDKLGPLG